MNFQAQTIEPQPGDIAAVIVISAPRDQQLPADRASPDDWSMEDALEVAARFLPPDARLSTTQAATPAVSDLSADGPGSVACHSDTLTEADFGRGAGAVDCQVSLLGSGPEAVSFITLALAEPGEASDALDPCAGAPDWAAATGENLRTATDLIASIQDLDLSGPAAATDLTAIADDLDAVRADQEALAPPSAGSRAQATILTALEQYAGAIRLAADGIDTGDDSLVRQATVDIETARETYALADGQLLAALQTCGLA